MGSSTNIAPIKLPDDVLAEAKKAPEIKAIPLPSDVIGEATAPEQSLMDKIGSASRSYFGGMTAGISDPVISAAHALTDVAATHAVGAQDDSGIINELKKAYADDVKHRKEQLAHGSWADTIAGIGGAFTPTPINVVSGIGKLARPLAEAIPGLKTGLSLAQEAAPAVGPGLALTAGQKLGAAASKIAAKTAEGGLTGLGAGTIDQLAQRVGGYSDKIDPSKIADEAANYALWEGGIQGLRSTPRLASGFAGLGKQLGEAVAPGPTAKAAKVVDVAGGVADSLKNAARALGKTVKPSIRAEYEKDVLTALENGVDPEHLSSAIKYGPDSFISKGDRVHAQGVAGEQQLAAHQAGLNDIRDATNRRISGFAGGEAPMDPTAAGEFIRNEHAKAVDNLFDHAEVTYDTIWKDHPGLQLSGNAVNEIGSKVEGVRRIAVGKAEHGATDEIASQGKRLLFTTGRLNELLKRGSYKQTVEELRNLGDYAFKTNNGVLAENRKLYRDLYFSMQKGLLDTVESQAGKDAADALRAQNEKFTQFFRNNEKIAPIIENTGKGGEQVFRELVQNGDSAKIRALKEILPLETHGKLKASYLENLKTEDKDGGFSFPKLNSTLRNNDKARVVQRELFEKGELDPFHRIAKLGEDHGQPILNYSGTDISTGFRKPLEALKEAALQESTLNTAKKMAEGTRPPMSAETMGQAIGHLARTQGGSGRIKVPAELHADLRHLIRSSTGDSVSKAKVLDSLNRFGEIHDVEALKSLLFPGPK